MSRAEIHHVRQDPALSDDDWRQTFQNARESNEDEVLVLLIGQRRAAENGAWIVRADGSHQRPGPSFHLAEVALLRLHLAVDRVEVLGAPRDVAREPLRADAPPSKL